MEPTNVGHPDYYHKVVDCQWACPAHTNVPGYIRLIAQERYDDAYMVNWESNVFPGILGRTCDRPCEPACRRTRVEDKPVAICRLKRVAADLRGDVTPRFPTIPERKNGKKIACVGAGPASLTVARDLMPLGYEVTIFEKNDRPGGLMWTNIPQFRLPPEVLWEEIDYILDMGVDIRYNAPVKSMKWLLDQGYDAIFVGSGAPRGKELHLPGRYDTDHIHIGIDWLESVAFGHTNSIEENVLVIGVGNTAMDCCRTSKRIGGTNVKVMARKSKPYFKASQWELEDTEEELVDIVENHSPTEFVVEDGVLKGINFDIVEWHENDAGRLVATKLDEAFFPADAVILAIGQETALTWIEDDAGIEFNKWREAVVDRKTFMSTREGVFFGGDAAWGPENIIWAAEHGHQAAISIHAYCHGEDLERRPPDRMNLVSAKMGLHEWSYSNDYEYAARRKMRHVRLEERLKSIETEVEEGFDLEQTLTEVERCLNCDLQTHFTGSLCIECDACIDICPLNCLTITHNGEEAELRTRLIAPAENTGQDLYVSEALPQTSRVMVKDEDLCIHCGLCAERCPTAAWDMRTFDLLKPYAGQDDDHPYSGLGIEEMSPGGLVPPAP
ncbi:FAD-dependent oxidoreductase [Candidatus Palauibacter sp.]|uniref:FAD-dependent oxidoreductase n=1 Tax=Candidatus Palauibacter sp. TaxID=3101350 RepID=UPI003B58D918